MGVEDQRVVNIADRPALIPVAAGWRWAAFDQERGGRLDRAEAAVAAQNGRTGTPQCFVLLHQGIPVGTASLTADDSASRPELGPWLASVVVAPEARGQGHATTLVRVVEEAARAAGFTRLWLYTRDAEALYARLGWQRIGMIEEDGTPVTLMRRDLQAAGASGVSGAALSSRK